MTKRSKPLRFTPLNKAAQAESSGYSEIEKITEKPLAKRSRSAKLIVPLRKPANAGNEAESPAATSGKGEKGH